MIFLRVNKEVVKEAKAIDNDATENLYVVVNNHRATKALRFNYRFSN